MANTSGSRPSNAKTIDQQIRDALQSGPSGAAAGDRQPIGVPQGYVGGKQPTVGYGDTLDENPEGHGLQPARYFEGDELLPANLSPSDVAKLQKELADAGLLKGKFRLGFWDAASQKAYSEALAYANQTGTSIQRAIGDLKTHPEQGDDKIRAPLVTKTSSPEELRSTFRDVSRKLLGRQLSDAELSPYINAYNQVELQRQREAYAIEDPAGQGGNVMGIPDPSSFIEERMRTEHPVDVGAHSIASRANEFYDLLGSFGGQG
jgi:hypothetical protein